MATTDFSSLGLATPILKAINDLGYEQPSPIQQQAIPYLLDGENLLGVAQTGTGKTGAFALPLLSRISAGNKSPQILVLAPTRELAIQVAEAFKSYSRHIKNFHVIPIYGGQDIRGQLKALNRGADVVVGTPGRLLDHLKRSSLKLDDLKAVVLDEADEMLRMGFIEDIETILGQTPDTAQRALFSATMPAPIKRVANKYIGDAQEVRVAAKTRTVEKIEQQYLIVHFSHKLDTLTRILEVEQFDAMIIFVRTKSMTIELAEKLEARGFSAHALNGDLNQGLREKIIARLKNGGIDIIVATDVAARGLDVERISHVVNFDIPYDTESYVHRIGRTGRAGREGKAILFVTPKERRLLGAIEKANRQKLTALQVPTGEQVSQQRIARFQSNVQETIQSQDLSSFRELVEQLAHDTETDVGEIAAALVSQAQQDRPLFPKFAPLPDASRPSRGDRNRGNQSDRGGRERPSRRTDKSEAPRRPRKPKAVGENMERFRIEAGLDHGVGPGDIVGALANEAGIDGEYIGNISINNTHSTVDLPEGMPKEIFEHLKKTRVRQQPMKISRVDAAGSEPPADKRVPPKHKPRKSNKPKTRSKATKATKDKPKKSRKPKEKLTLKKSTSAEEKLTSD